jgi:hypothetical protein
VRATAGDPLEWRIDLVHRIESETSSSVIPPEPPPRAVSDAPAAAAAEATSGVVRTGSADDETVDEPAPRLYRDEDEGAALTSSSAFHPEVTSATGLRQTSRRTIRIAVAAVALLVVGSLALIVRVVQLQTSSAEAAPAPSAAEAESAIGLEIARPPSATRAASAPPPSAPPPLPPATSGARPAAPPAAPPKPPNECDPPYYLDGKGGHHPKPYCKH